MLKHSSSHHGIVHTIQEWQVMSVTEQVHIRSDVNISIYSLRGTPTKAFIKPLPLTAATDDKHSCRWHFDEQIADS